VEVEERGQESHCYLFAMASFKPRRLSAGRRVKARPMKIDDSRSVFGAEVEAKVT